DRQEEREPGARGVGSLHFHGSPMSLHHSLHQGETQAHARGVRSLPTLARENDSKTCGRSAREMPGPRSSTEIRTRSPSRRSTFWARIAIHRPVLAYRTAF